MGTWKYQLDVSPFFHNEDITLEEKSKKLVETLKSRPWYEKLYHIDEVEQNLEEIVDAGEADDVMWFDACWDNLYDIFDAERVWVVTR